MPYRVFRLPLFPTKKQVSILKHTSQEFTRAFNFVCEIGWENHCKNGVILHHLTYKESKTKFPSLVSDFHVQARVKATGALKALFTKANKGQKVSQPKSLGISPLYEKHTFKIYWDRGFVRLSTTSGRQSILFSIPKYVAKYSSCKERSAELKERDGKWFLNVSVKLEIPEIQKSAQITGVDLGLSNPAVTSNNKFFGKRRWKATEKKHFNLRRNLQKAGTKSAKRHLKRLRRKLARFHRDCDHVLSKQIVQSVEPGSTIVLENLKNIRKTAKVHYGAQARRLHSWSFAQLKSFIEYKAEERGCTVVGIDPRHTSQTCSRCGHVARNNRRSRAWFKCRKCGFQLHADLNGARNITAKYLANESKSLVSGLPVDQPIVDISLSTS